MYWSQNNELTYLLLHRAKKLAMLKKNLGGVVVIGSFMTVIGSVMTVNRYFVLAFPTFCRSTKLSHSIHTRCRCSRARRSSYHILEPKWCVLVASECSSHLKIAVNGYFMLACPTFCRSTKLSHSIHTRCWCSRARRSPYHILEPNRCVLVASDECYSHFKIAVNGYFMLACPTFCRLTKLSHSIHTRCWCSRARRSPYYIYEPN